MNWKQYIMGNSGKCAYSIQLLKYLSLSPNSSNNDAPGVQDGSAAQSKVSVFDESGDPEHLYLTRWE